MNLFDRTSRKSALQRGLDNDRVEHGTSAPESLADEGCQTITEKLDRLLFRKATNPAPLFRVNLSISSWTKP